MNSIVVKVFTHQESKSIVRLILLCLLLLSLSLAHSGDELSPRLKIGKSLLPAIIAANKNLVDFLDNDGKLIVYVVYQENKNLASALVNGFSGSSRIQNYAVEYIVIPQVKLLRKPLGNPAAIFLVEPVRENIKQLVNLSYKTGAILFSPFKGDIERGVATGFQVTDKVLPMVNLTSLRRSRVNLKAFFLRIAVKYEK